MTLIRQIIRNLIVESVGHPKMDELVQRFLDDPRGLMIVIDSRAVYDGYLIEMIDPKETTEFDLNVIGKVAIAKYSNPKRQCHGAYQIVGYSRMNQQENLGPLLYDIAIEITGKNGLMSDRAAVSEEAYDVWEKYLLMRDDVKRKQLDDYNFNWTKDPGDNCNLDVSSKRWNHSGLWYGAESEADAYRDWVQGEKTSPLSKVYYKEGKPVHERLKDRIVRNRKSITSLILGAI